MEALAEQSSVVPLSHNFMRGDVYMVDLNLDAQGREQRGYRPCVIVSNNTGNKFSSIVTILPISSSHKAFKGHVPISSVPLAKDSVVTCEQMRTLDKSRLKNHVGRLSDEEIKSIDKTLAMCLGLKF